MKKYLIFGRIAAYFIFLLFFALLPIASFEEKSFCVYYNLFGFLCAGCGVTRGFCCFMHFDFAKAAEFNPVFTYAIFPISIFLMIEDSLLIILRFFKKSKRKSLLEEGIEALTSIF